MIQNKEIDANAPTPLKAPAIKTEANDNKLASLVLDSQCKDSENLQLPQIFLCGNDYFEVVGWNNPDLGRIETNLERRTIHNLTMRLGKDQLAKLPYFDKMVNVPGHHKDYKRVFPSTNGNGCVNLYNPLDYELAEGTFETIMTLIRHIFGELWLLGLDYLTILYRYPRHILPVVCLVSKMQGTGKTTFLMFLSYLFGKNMQINNKAGLNSDFNSYARCLIVAFEELSSAKTFTDKIKELSTAKTTMLNEKHKDVVKIDAFLKIIICSNSEDDFIKANEEDIRYLILKIDPIEEYDPQFEEKIKAEIPAFAKFLSEREIAHKEESRMWFHPDLLKTAQREKVIANSRSDCAKDIQSWVNDYCSENETVYICATIKDIANDIQPTYKRSEIESALKNEFMLTPKDGRYTNYLRQGGNGRYYTLQRVEPDVEVINNAQQINIPNDSLLPF